MQEDNPLQAPLLHDSNEAKSAFMRNRLHIHQC